MGQQYSVQLFALDDRSLSPAGSARTVDWQSPPASTNVSPAYAMAANDYIVGTFTAANTVQPVQENLLNSGYGNFNCLVLRAVGWNPPPYFIVEPGNVTNYLGSSVSLSGAATGDSTIPNPNLTYQWAAGPAGGLYTNLVGGAKYGGTTTTNLTINNLTTNDAAVVYVLVASNGGGATTSRPASLIVATPSPTYGSLAHRYSFNETNGSTTATDSIGGAVWNGTLPNGGAFTNGQLSFSAASQQYLALPGGILSGDAAVTIEMWVPAIAGAATSPPFVYLFAFGDTDGSGNGYDYIFFNPNQARVTISAVDPGYDGEQGGNLASSLGLATNLHLTCVFDCSNGVISVYTNGVLASAFTGITDSLSSVGNEYAYIGRSLYTGDAYLTWTLEELRVYNAALSGAEVAATDALGPNQLLSTNNPPMSAALTGKNLTLSWPLANAGFTLQSNTNLPSGIWVNTTSPVPQIVSNQWRMILPPPTNTASIFYRLIK